MKQVVLYLRVSSDEQVRGSSLDSQQSSCEEYCRRNDMQVVKVFREEGESARTDNRPLFQEMLRYCADRRNHVDHVLVYKLDRFARNSTDHHINAAALLRSKVTVRSATEPIADDPVGHLLETVLAGIAQFDNDIRGERSRMGMLRIAERGGWNFKAPLGYVISRAPDGLPILAIDPVTGPLVVKLFEALATGRYTAAGVRVYSKELGLRAPCGRPLHEQTLHKMLRTDVYAGRITGALVSGKTIKAAFPSLVPENLFDRVQAVLAGQGHVPSPHLRSNPSFPLRGLMICSKCGHVLTASYATGGHGKRYGQYRCKNSKCKGVNVRMETAEQAFMNLLLEIKIETTPLLQTFRTRIIDEWSVRHAEVIATQGLVKVRADELLKQQDSLLDKFIRGIVDEATFTRKNTEISRLLVSTKADYKNAAGDEFDIDMAIKLACAMVQNAGRLWYKLQTVENRQRLQRALFPEGLVYDQEKRFGTSISTWPVRVMSGNISPYSQLAPPRVSNTTDLACKAKPLAFPPYITVITFYNASAVSSSGGTSRNPIQHKRRISHQR